MFVGKRVKWQHDRDLCGHSKECISFNQLTPIQWVTGFCRSMRENFSFHTRDYLLDYLVNLLEDATDF